MKELLQITGLLIVMIGLTSCAEVVDPENTTANDPLNITLTRKNQHTIRYNCAGEVVSDRIETRNNVKKSFKIKAEERSDLWGFSAINRETGDSRGRISNGMGRFTVDIAPTVFHIQVIPGLNEINYEFTYCYDVVYDSENQTTTCAHTPDVEQSGTMWIDVDYKEVTLEGTSHIHPSEETCAEQG
jgi:hypothetical protein